MTHITTLTFHSDEMETLIDALEADHDDYAEAAKEATEEGDTEEAAELSAAAQRVHTLLQKVRGASND